MTKIVWTVLLVLAASLPSTALSQQYFGRFLDSLRGEFNIDARPRPTFRLEADFRFEDPDGLRWLTPAGTEVDGASIPQFFWTFIGGPFEGRYINASVIHDHYCRTRERDARDTHRNFYFGMRASGVERWKAEFLYWAVSTFGPNWKLQPRVSFSHTCVETPGGGASCTTTPTVAMALVDSPTVDLSDPDVLAFALSKATAVAKTLRTTGGRILDVSSEGPVLASAENIQASSDAYRTVFASKDFYASTAKLGLMANVQPGINLAAVQPWPGNEIPQFAEAGVLTPATLHALHTEQPFTVDERSKGLVRDRVDIDAAGGVLIFEVPE